jgi:hypothetical protein
MRFAPLAVLPLLLAGCAAGSAPSAACDDAFTAAAAVPFDHSNAQEFIATFDACTTVAEWSSALQAQPAAGAVPEITDAEVLIYLKLGCSQLPDAGDGNAICDEAHRTGVID